MGDILIHGMEMPKDYSIIIKIFPDGRVGMIPYVQWFKVDLIPGTQAVPVPPHGRCIDADALEYKEAYLNGHYELGDVEIVTRKDIESAPTVLEAGEDKI